MKPVDESNPSIANVLNIPFILSSTNLTSPIPVCPSLFRRLEHHRARLAVEVPAPYVVVDAALVIPMYDICRKSLVKHGTCRKTKKKGSDDRKPFGFLHLLPPN